MNQEKIGKFIAMLRKENNMTQTELANRLGITDRAISKWENGRGMPDLSLIKPLCEELNVSINELLNGERLVKEEYNKKSEQILLDTLDYSNKKVKSTKKTFKLVITLICLIVSMFVIAFLIDVNRMRNNMPVVFSTWGFRYTPPVNLKELELEHAIYEYLISKNESEDTKHLGEKWFVSPNIYSIEEIMSETRYNVYSWVLEKSYYLENNEIKLGSGSSMPYKFVVEKKEDEFVVTDFKVPRDGSLYAEDMKNIFPHSVRSDMEKIYSDGIVEKLQMDIDRQVKLYFCKN